MKLFKWVKRLFKKQSNKGSDCVYSKDMRYQSYCCSCQNGEDFYNKEPFETFDLETISKIFNNLNEEVTDINKRFSKLEKSKKV